MMADFQGAASVFRVLVLCTLSNCHRPRSWLTGTRTTELSFMLFVTPVLFVNSKGLLRKRSCCQDSPAHANL